MSRRPLFRLLALAVVFVTIGGRPAYARECRRDRTGLPGILGVDGLFSSARSARSPKPKGGRRVTFDVEQVERGRASRR